MSFTDKSDRLTLGELFMLFSGQRAWHPRSLSILLAYFD